nr:MAG TPA: hypothetical protein [Caudoviricetes sp.]
MLRHKLHSQQWYAKKSLHFYLIKNANHRGIKYSVCVAPI